MRMLCIALLAGSVGLLFYIYVGYPALIFLWAQLYGRPVKKGDALPTVTVLVIAHNEAEALKQKIPNLLELDYPKDLIEIAIASDGSDDGTTEVVGQYLEKGVRLFAFPRRRGKPAVLNDTIPNCAGEIVVLADARQQFDRQAVRALVENFNDPEVGCVSGELIFLDEESSSFGRGVSAYWSYEKFLRKNEATIFSTVGATGAIYAIRRSLFEAIPEDTILDDIAVPMSVTMKHLRTVFEPGARAYDFPSATGRAEFRRKARTLGGNFQIFWRNLHWLCPFRSPVWFQALSHKVLRLSVPLWLIVILVTNVCLWREPIFRCTLALQVTFYLLAIAWGIWGQKERKGTNFLSRAMAIPYVFMGLNLAVVAGFWLFVSGRLKVTWPRSEKSPK